MELFAAQFRVEVRLGRIVSLKLHDNADRRRFFSCEAKLALGKVEADDMVAMLGQFNSMTTSPTGDVQNLLRPIALKLSFNEIHFAHGSLSEALFVVSFSEIGKKRFIPLCHVGFSIRSAKGNAYSPHQLWIFASDMDRPSQVRANPIRLLSSFCTKDARVPVTQDEQDLVYVGNAMDIAAYGSLVSTKPLILQCGF